MRSSHSTHVAVALTSPLAALPRGEQLSWSTRLDNCQLRGISEQLVGMPSDLRNYIASRYLVADPKPSSKKRKRKQPAATGLLITDDDDSTWARVKARPDDEDDDPTMVPGSTAEFRNIKKSNWKKVGGGSSAADSTNDEKAAADAILAAAAAENEAARAADDEEPVIDTGADAVRMSDGTHAGLQTLAAVSAQLKRRREEQDEFEKHRTSAKEEETVYRDATGRRIDISMKRAEARKAAAEAQKKELLAKEALKGQVQLEKARQEKEQLRDEKLMLFARKADDEQMNQELKEQDRWNDPMKQFLGDKKSEVSKGKASKRRPVYVGGAPPNRYGIKPGYRWDGVDRGNGSEAERFKAINRRERSKGLEYSWQMDE